jgi:hypothetical protein
MFMSQDTVIIPNKIPKYQKYQKLKSVSVYFDCWFAGLSFYNFNVKVKKFRLVSVTSSYVYSILETNLEVPQWHPETILFLEH